MKISHKNRWIVIVGGMIIQLCLGIIYAWSVFTIPLGKAIEEGGKRFTASQSAWIFSIGIFTFSVFMIISGRLMKRNISTKMLTAIGGLLLGVGYVIAGYSGGSFLNLLLSIGIMGGAGIGLAYAVPLKIGISWYPDKVGFVSGLAVAGFGFGAMFWIKAAGSWFGGGFLNNLSIFNLPGLESTFVLYGAILIVGVMLGAIVMIPPPDDYVPDGWNPETDALDPSFESIDLQGSEMLRTPQFRLMFSMFLLSAFAGLMVIYCIKLFGIDALSSTSVAKASMTAGTAMAVYAIMNGLGRILYGRLSDMLGRRKTLRIMMFSQTVMMACFFWLGQSSLGLILGAGVIGLNFGGNFALFPATTAVYFGKKNIGENYGWVFLAYGLAGIFGPLFAGFIKDTSGSATEINFWLIPFLSAAAACFIAMILTFFLKIPSQKN